MKTQYDPNTLAAGLVDFAAHVDAGQKFNRDTMHLFCSPLFLRAMYMLYDKNIRTLSCGSGKERGILPGITCDYLSLTDENKKLADALMISPIEFRIGAEIKADTTLEQFEQALLEISAAFKQQ